MYVKTNKDKDLTPAERTLLSRLHAGGHGPDLAWYQSLVTRNHDQPESATCQRCVQADETMTDTRDDGLHSTTRCTEQSFQWGWCHHLPLSRTHGNHQLPEGFWPFWAQLRMITDRAPEQSNNNTSPGKKKRISMQIKLENRIWWWHCFAILVQCLLVPADVGFGRTMGLFCYGWSMNWTQARLLRHWGPQHSFDLR